MLADKISVSENFSKLNLYSLSVFVQTVSPYFVCWVVRIYIYLCNFFR